MQKDTDLKQTSSIEEFTEVLMDLVAENDDSLVVSGDRKSNRLILKFEGDSLDLRRFPAATVVADENNLVIIQFSTEEDAEACLQALQQNVADDIETAPDDKCKNQPEVGSDFR